MKLMIVDDTQSNLELFKEILEKEFDVITFLDANLAIESIPTISPDLILLDYVMPDVLGHVVLQKIKAAYSNIPVIVISGFRVEDFAVNSLDKMADDFIYKPVLEEELIARIKNKIEKFKKIELAKALDLCFEFDDFNESVHIENESYILKGKEYRLFKYLYGKKNQIVPREEIFANVWMTKYVSPATLDTHLCQLRKKLDKYGNRIVTRKNSGFLYSSADV